MKYVSTKRAKELDRIAIERYGIPSLILMENAGRGIADLAECILSKKGTGKKYCLPRRQAGLSPFSRKVLVVAGKGNNGGDGFVAARHLVNHGHKVQVVLLAKADDLRNDPKVNYGILKRMDVPIESITSERRISRLRTVVHKSDLIIDGIFGVGLTRPVSGLFYDVISILNASRKRILAIDVPSGLNSDSGEKLGIAIKAYATGTLGAAKRGLFLKNGPACNGKITVLDISIPKKLLL